MRRKITSRKYWSIRIILLPLIVGFLFGISGRNAIAFRLEVPEEIKKLPREEQLKWLNAQVKESRELQVEVGQERTDQRQKDKQAIAQEMQDEAAQHDEAMVQLKSNLVKKEQAAASRDNLTYSFMGILLIGSLAGYLYYKRREA